MTVRRFGLKKACSRHFRQSRTHTQQQQQQKCSNHTQWPLACLPEYHLEVVEDSCPHCSWPCVWQSLLLPNLPNHVRAAAAAAASLMFLPSSHREAHLPSKVVVPERSSQGGEGGDVTQPYLLADVYAAHPLPFTRKVRAPFGVNLAAVAAQ